MGRPREHGERTGEALLDAAEELLASGGSDAVSVRAVADAAGTTTRAVYSVFGSKDGLVCALATRGYRFLAQRVHDLPPSDDAAADLLAAGLQGFRAFAVQRPHLFRLTFERIPSEVAADQQVQAAALASYQALVHWIRRAQEAGVIDGRPEEEVAFAFHSLCQGLAGGELSTRPPPVGTRFWRPIHGIDGERLWRNAVGALIAGLAPPRAGDPRDPVEPATWPATWPAT